MTFDTSNLEAAARPLASIARGFHKHMTILGALIMREMATRFGRQGLGFLWLVGEPLIFCFGVIILWSLTKPPFENGIKVGPFVMTGYMCLIVVRHMISQLTTAVQANKGLLYHRQIQPTHILLSRIILEFGGNTMALAIVYIALLVLGQVDLPHNYLLVYSGWVIFTLNGIGVALILTGLMMFFEIFERLTNLIGYLMIPLSGAFFMVGWLPESARETYLLVPLVHGVEMLRAGVFGDSVKTYYDWFYPAAFGSCMTIIGLLMISAAKDRVDAE